MTALHLPIGENLLMAAFRAVVEGRSSEQPDLAAAYQQHFKSAVAVPPAQPHIFERFSLVDPSIRMTVQSSTATS